MASAAASGDGAVGGRGAAGTAAGPGSGGAGGRGGGTLGPVPEGCNVTFDPNRVYMFATLQEGESGRQAIALPEEPANFCVGFEEALPPVVRPSDQALVYLGSEKYADGDSVRVFSPESLFWNDSQGSWEYPEGAAGNDDVVPTPQCESVATFLVDAQDGYIVYRCGSDTDGNTYTEDGRQPFDMPGGDFLVSYGHGDFKLAVSAYHLIVLDPMNTVIEIPAIVWPGHEYVTARARVDGFWVVTVNQSSTFERWFVDFTGAATLEGKFSAPPEGVLISPPGTLGGDGSLVSMGMHDDDLSHDVIVRSPIEPAPSAVIYDEWNGPRGFPEWTSHDNPGFYPKVHISYLFTGP